MIPIKSANDIEAMRQGGKILAQILAELKVKTVPGIKRSELESLAKRLCLKYHAKASFLGYKGYPNALCVSLNNEVVHGIPNESKICSGDLVSLDMGIFYAGFHTDAAISFVCPSANVYSEQSRRTQDKLSQGQSQRGQTLKKSQGLSSKGTVEQSQQGQSLQETAERLIKTAENAFFSACDLVRDGVRLGDISAKIQEVSEHDGFGVIRMLVGHGIGREVHEEPPVPNYGTAGTGPILKTGMTLAIEPMITEGGYDVILSDDKWTYVTRDNSRAAHFEHTVLVTDQGFEILTQL